MLSQEDYENAPETYESAAETYESAPETYKNVAETDKQERLLYLRQESVRSQQEFPEVQRPLVPAQNEDFGEFIIRYNEKIEEELKRMPETEFLPVNEVFGIFYAPLGQLVSLEISNTIYSFIPKCYAYMDLEAQSASGITRLHTHPFLQLQGKGTVVAVIDSGIDYRNPVFIKNGSSRIAYLWDQTLEGGQDERVPYGRVFTRDMINQALRSGQPLELVPSVDTNGHGTALAGIAAGNRVQQERFSGAAPEADLIIVKLKPAKMYLREFYLFPPEVEIVQEDDVMLGMAYALRWSIEMNMPLSVCLGIGSNQGAHQGESPLCQYIDYVMSFRQAAVSIAAGNEGASRHHFYGELNDTQRDLTAEIRVGENESGFTLEMWAGFPEPDGVSLQAPSGETLEVSGSIGSVTQELSFVFVETKVLVNYVGLERRTGNLLVYFRFLDPAAGIWKIRTWNRNGRECKVNMWLPVQGLISEGTYFLESSPYMTVTTPGDSREGITMTAYQYLDNSLYLQAGRGFKPDGGIVPQLAAPGVDLLVPVSSDAGAGTYMTMSGTSLAAAQCAGAAALLFEWAVVRENQPYFTGVSVQFFLRRGAVREENLPYPNREWGYGRLDLYRTFELII